MQKIVLGVHPAPQGHWVGDGFPVRSLFTYDKYGELLSPFLMLDHAGPAQFSPTPPQPRGVGEHPHRGFETVTIVYSGEVAHRDSAGNGGTIGPGDVQWMTAAAGVLHDEFHSPGFTRRGGVLEMVQLWVNLPAKYKMTAPRYQAISQAAIPEVPLSGAVGNVPGTVPGTVRVIAGAFTGQPGAAATFTELNVWDVRMNRGGRTTLAVPGGHNTAIAVLRGTLLLGGATPVRATELAILDRVGDEVAVEAGVDAVFLLLSGVPLTEPVVGYGPFVMNSRQEIEAAVNDFRQGKFGRMPVQAAVPAAADSVP